MCFSANGRTARKSRSACWAPREPIAYARPCPAGDTWDNKRWSWFFRATLLWTKPGRQSKSVCRRWSGPRVRLFIKSQTGLKWAQQPPVRPPRGRRQMEDGRWKTGDERWTIGRWLWKMEDRRLKMAWERKIEDRRLEIAHLPTPISYLLPVRRSSSNQGRPGS